MASPDLGRKATVVPAELPADARPLLGVIGVTAFYPITVARTLAQVGYEPMAPYTGVSFWTRKPGQYYPNMLSYVNHLRKTEGFTVMFTGLTPRILSAVAANAIEGMVERTIRTNIPDRTGDAGKQMRGKGILSTAYEITVECASKSVSVVVTQPLQVVMVRMICSIASKDEVYRGFFSTIREIYKTEGVSGFFSGLVPRWIAEVGALALSGAAMYFVYRIMENVGLDDETLNNNPNYNALIQLYIYGLVYPFQLASTVTAASCNRLKLDIPAYPSWRDHYTDLSILKRQHRGQSMFYRAAV